MKDGRWSQTEDKVNTIKNKVPGSRNIDVVEQNAFLDSAISFDGGTELNVVRHINCAKSNFGLEANRSYY